MILLNNSKVYLALAFVAGLITAETKAYQQHIPDFYTVW